MEKQNGKIFNHVTLLNMFYHNCLPFKLTNGQKETIRDIYRDLSSRKQMNRLLQGHVGCEKTIVAFLAMLMVIGSKAQVSFMVPTDILAIQHFYCCHTSAQQLNLNIPLLIRSIKKRGHIFYIESRRAY